MTGYRFLDGMGDVVAEEEFVDHPAALAWASDDAERDEDIQRVEYLAGRVTPYRAAGRAAAPANPYCPPG